MNEHEFMKNFTVVDTWVNTMRPHWTHLNGDVHNDKDFWGMCIHSVKPEVWTAWCQVYAELKQSHPQYFRKHTHIYEDTVEIATRLDKDQAISKPYNKTGYNKPIFRAAMAIKDIVAEITERPFTTKAVPAKTKKTKPTREEVMAEFAKMQTMIEDLFDTGE